MYQDVVLKGDENVVYIDASLLGWFIEMMRVKNEVYLWSDNIVKNGKGEILQK